MQCLPSHAGPPGEAPALSPFYAPEGPDNRIICTGVDLLKITAACEYLEIIPNLLDFGLGNTRSEDKQMYVSYLTLPVKPPVLF